MRIKSIKTIVITFIIIIFIRTFIIESNYVSSGSMTPTLIKGDYILTTKFSFGLFYPFSNKKIVNYSKPKRGEIVVFMSPDKEESRKNGFTESTITGDKFIKRVVAIENDTILMKDQVLYINGKKIKKTKKKYLKLDVFNANFFNEKIDDTTFTSINFIIKNKITSDFGVNKFNKISFNKKDIIEPYKVPNGYFFVIGDNRDDSFDSRFWGPIPNNNLQGKAIFRWFSYDKKFFWNRIFNFL